MVAVDQLLDYCATYPNNGITYIAGKLVQIKIKEQSMSTSTALLVGERRHSRMEWAAADHCTDHEICGIVSSFFRMTALFLTENEVETTSITTVVQQLNRSGDD